MVNLHICLNSFTNESRVLKQTESLITHDVFSEIFVAAIWKSGLAIEEQHHNGANIVRFKLLSRSLNPAILRYGIMYIEFAVRMWWFFRKRKVACLNVHSVGILPLGCVLKYLWCCHLVYDAHELESLADGLSPTRQKVFGCIEKLLIKKADLVIVVSESIASWYQSAYSIDKPAVILNVPKEVNLIESNILRETHSIPENKIILLYQGLLEGPRGVQLLLEQFSETGIPGYVVMFMGYGPMQQELMDAADKFGDIYFQPAVSPEILYKYTSSCDIGMSIVQNTCLSYYYSLPNKLFEYVMSGIPVIVSDCPDMRNFVNANNVGVVLESMTGDALKVALDKVRTSGLLNDRHRIHGVAVGYRWEVQETLMLDAYRDSAIGRKS